LLLIIEYAALQRLLPQESKYLSNLLGFMGPKNVLMPLVKLKFTYYLINENIIVSENVVKMKLNFGMH
jgi:hypothetical protein